MGKGYYRERMENMKASEILATQFAINIREYINLTELDIDSKQLFNHYPLESMVALDASYLDLTDQDLINMAESKSLRSLVWLSLAENPKITEVGVKAICQAIKERRMDPEWIDLKGTGYCATPYLDDDVDYAGKMNPCTWRIGKNGNDLMNEFGHQRWMSFGRPIEKMDVELIDSATYPRNRFPHVEFKPFSSGIMTICLPYQLHDYLADLNNPGFNPIGHVDNRLILEILAKFVRSRGDAPEWLESTLQEIEKVKKIT